MRYQSHWSCFADPSPAVTRQATQLGYYVLLHRQSHPSTPLDPGHLSRCVLPAIRQKRIAFYFDAFNQVAGCVIWAFVADDVRERLFRYGKFHLHESEWNEGEDLWIVELMAPFGHLKYMLRDLYETRFKEMPTISYLRTTRAGSVVMQHDLRSRRARKPDTTGVTLEA